MTARVTRLAPSPTGALHLGNARTFLINWAIARTNGWRIIMRIEDLDGPRIKSDAASGALRTLRWLGLDWDDEPLTQSDDLEPYRRALHTLVAERRAYACTLSRAEIEQAASAPHAGDHEGRYPLELRPAEDDDRFRFDREDTNYRFVVPERSVEIHDVIAGDVMHAPFDEVGDFVIWTKRGVPAYQLAVVVDDARQGVTDVIRGDDLLPSAARQTLLYEALDLTPPRWWHLPLVIGSDGRRLAKRHGDTRLDAYHAAGVAPERIVGLLARWSGIQLGARTSMSADEFQVAFDPAKLPRTPIVYRQEDHEWLLSG